MAPPTPQPKPINQLFSPTCTVMPLADKVPLTTTLSMTSKHDLDAMAESTQYIMDTRARLGVDDWKDIHHIRAHRKKYIPGWGKYNDELGLNGGFRSCIREVPAMPPKLRGLPAKAPNPGILGRTPSTANIHSSTPDISTNRTARAFNEHQGANLSDYSLTTDGVSTIGSLLFALTENMQLYTLPLGTVPMAMEPRGPVNLGYNAGPARGGSQFVGVVGQAASTGSGHGRHASTKSLPIKNAYARPPFDASHARDYFAPFAKPPEWTVDRSKDGNRSFFGEPGWEKVPERVGRDRRYQWGGAHFRRNNVW